MGRRQEPLVGDGPVVGLAGGLRDLRASTGLTLRELATRSGYAHTTLAAAERGRDVPSWAVTEAFVQACGGVPADWRGHWEAASGPGAVTFTAPLAVLTSTVTPAELPHETPGFTGRRDELTRLQALVPAREADASRAGLVICVIDGMAGVGKTALAVRLGRQVADRYPDGQLFVDLHGLDPHQPPLTPEAALERLLGSVGVPAAQIPADLERRAGLYRSVLAGRRLLIVLDDAATAEQVRPLLPGGAGCLVIVTSRLRLAGLVARNGAHLLTLRPLALRDAVDMLRRILGPGAAAGMGAAAALASLCDCLPLALRIAAERAATHPHLTLAGPGGTTGR